MSYDPEDRRTTPLALKLIERIHQNGPISVSQFMQACLQDEEYGYYRKKPAIGADGDFVTAPEISQIFGELIGLWCAVVWQQMGSPESVRLLELGPGRATLMRDALRASRILPAFHKALSVDLIETNEQLAAIQRQTLAGDKAPMRWHEDIAAATQTTLPTILIANEFLDTLPASQWQLTPSGEWVERQVGVSSSGTLCFTTAKTTNVNDRRLPSLLAQLPTERPTPGAILQAQDYATLAKTLKDIATRMPLAALFIDYGHLKTATGDSLQAVREHKPEHPLTSPGESDLTIEVNFADFVSAMSGTSLVHDGPVTQSDYLANLGITERAVKLMATNPDEAGAIEIAVARLMAPQGMGTRFKVVALRSVGLPPLPGFEAQNPRPRSKTSPEN